jgi:hypothetical protein
MVVQQIGRSNQPEPAGFAGELAKLCDRPPTFCNLHATGEDEMQVIQLLCPVFGA